MSDKDKKLSEIGREMWIEEIYTKDKRDAYEIAHSAGVLLKDDNIRAAAVRVHVYDDNERRELVRSCLKKIFAEIEMAGLPFDRMDRQIIDDDIETFIKREGL